jgi:CarD family transcriptional regulator
MFAVDEKVVYPGHGVARIKAIIEKVVGATSTSFYELIFINKEMTILVPTASAHDIGVRALSSTDKISDDVYTVLAQPARKITYQELSASNWNKRNKLYQCKLRTGNLTDISEIYRDLKHIAMHKQLSFGEKSLLQKTEALLAQEISLVNQMQEDKAIEYLRSFF